MDQIDTAQSGVADEIIQGLLASLITILVEHPDQEDACQFGQDMYEDLRKWDRVFAGGSDSKLSELVSSIARSPKRRKQEVHIVSMPTIIAEQH